MLEQKVFKELSADFLNIFRENFNNKFTFERFTVYDFVELSKNFYSKIFEELEIEYCGEFDNVYSERIWSYLEGEELDREEYRFIRQHFINNYLKINLNDVDSSKCRKLIISKMLEEILSLDSLKITEKFTNKLVLELLNSFSIKKYYRSPTDNKYMDDYKDILRFSGNVDVEYCNELDDVEYSETFKLSDRDNLEYQLDYNKILDTSIEDLYLVVNRELLDSSISSQVISNINVNL